MSAAPDVELDPGNLIDFSVVATHTGDVTFGWSVTKDGAPFTSGDGEEISFTPTDAGSYIVTVNATDSNGTGTKSVTIAVGTQIAAPVVDLSAAPTNGDVGTAIDFTATAFSTSTSGTPLVFAWTVDKDGTVFASGEGAEVNFTPDQSGTYNVTVTATDDTGTGSTTTSIDVGSTVQINPSVSLTGPSTFAPGVNYTLGFTNVDPGTDPIDSTTRSIGVTVPFRRSTAPRRLTRTSTTRPPSRGRSPSRSRPPPAISPAAQSRSSSSTPRRPRRSQASRPSRLTSSIR